MMKGATTRQADRDVCLNEIAGQTYMDPDMNTVFCCSTSPEIIDLSLNMANDTQLGFVEYYCRNGGARLSRWSSVKPGSEAEEGVATL